MSTDLEARKTLLEGRVIAFSIALKASPTRVWQALIQPDEIAAWSYPERVELDHLEPGGVYGFITDDAEDEDGAEILELDAPSYIKLRWYSSEPQPTVLEFRVERQGDYTLLHFRNSGFFDGPEWDKAYGEDYEGWVSLILQLRELVESS